MERIQSAIAKARAQRQAETAAKGQQPEPHSGAATTAQTGADRAGALPARDSRPPDPVAAAWAALPEYRVRPNWLVEQRVYTLTGGRAAGPFDVMRTRLLQQVRANNWKRVAITSPSPGCGKSTVAMNLAFSLARQSELRTILAELDLRRPSLSRMLEIRGRRSFAAVLEGRADFSDCAMCHADGLALAVNEGTVRNPAELLQSSAVPGVIAGIEDSYQPDLMLFDMPPIMVSDDAMAFMGQVDAVLLIAAAEMTTIKEIDRCEAELASQTNVMGVVLNKCRYATPSGGYDYYG